MTSFSAVHPSVSLYQTQSECCHPPCIHPCGQAPLTNHPTNHPTKAERILRVVEKIALIAIGIFSAMTSLPLFVSSFAVGLAIGLWDGKKFADKTHTHHDQSLCAHGFIEHLTEVKLPASLAFTANLAILVAHVDHHPTVFIPIIGATLGLRAGSMLRP